jgi:deazaflavin-dependent oxidoreductase (nitroreductase family)
MAVVLHELTKPALWLRIFFRVPVWFFRLGLGFLFAGKFILLEHIGRKSGITRYHCVEVIERRDLHVAPHFTIVSGYGERSQWYRNIKATPTIQVHTGRGRSPYRAEFVSPSEGADLMAAYAEAHPKLAKELMMVCGAEVDGSETDYREVAEKRLRFLRLSPAAG